MGDHNSHVTRPMAWKPSFLEKSRASRAPAAAFSFSFFSVNTIVSMSFSFLTVLIPAQEVGSHLGALTVGSHQLFHGLEPALSSPRSERSQWCSRGHCSLHSKEAQRCRSSQKFLGFGHLFLLLDFRDDLRP